MRNHFRILTQKAIREQETGLFLLAKLHVLSRHLWIEPSIPYLGAPVVLASTIEPRPILMLFRCPRLGGSDGTAC
jgi:hypothetical protein